MYHTIVARIARANFERVNEHDHESLLKGCTDNIRHRFGGDHALGGTRHDKAALRKWFERLASVVPNLRLNVEGRLGKGKEHITSRSKYNQLTRTALPAPPLFFRKSQGWPWDTTIIMRWTATDKFPDGSAYNNHGVHIIKMKWLKVYDIDANEDSQIVAAMMRAQADAGKAEAAMPAIES